MVQTLPFAEAMLALRAAGKARTRLRRLQATDLAIVARLMLSDRPMQPLELVRELSMGGGTTCRALDRLTDAGLVSRARAKDRRRRMVELTEEGRSTFAFLIVAAPQQAEAA